jgi:ABC-2 type transport system permease protein
MKDAWAVALKEWRELVGQRGLQGRQGLLLFLGAFGVVLPLMNGREWITSPVMAVAWAWVPMFLVMTIIADAFAGERERHTLETLLATRLSEASILFGKMGAAIGYSAAMCAASMIAGLIVINIAYPGPLALYRAQTVFAMAAFGAVGSIFVAALGSMISLRAPTVRQAQQTLGGMIVVVFMVPIWAVRALPDWSPDTAAAVRAAAGAQLAIAVVGALILIDAALVAFALSRFRRNRIIVGR